MRVPWRGFATCARSTTLVDDSSKQVTRFERVIAAQPAEVYRAFTVEGALRAWLCDIAEVGPRPGGRFYLWWARGYGMSGTYTELAPNERLAFTWRGDSDASKSEVRIKLVPGDGGTRLTLEHHGDASTDWAKLAFLSTHGWDAALENLQSALQTGIDLRVARRPVLGISEGFDLDQTLVQRLGVTPDALCQQPGLPAGMRGFVIDIAVEGYPAQLAGLQRNDVLV